mmetsp:Transcript_39758/g.98273  ORF Transcript_39758/g.98273 Transcript_39758/m.98273 type:complete len:127 (-) Transcript_39758:33-413(-)
MGLYAMHPGTPVSDETDGRTGSESPVPRFGATEYVSGSVTPLGLSVANPHSLLVNPLNSSAEGTLQQVINFLFVVNERKFFIFFIREILKLPILWYLNHPPEDRHPTVPVIAIGDPLVHNPFATSS